MNRVVVRQTRTNAGCRDTGLQFFFKNAPYSVAAAALPGLVNYGIIIFLTHSQDFAAAGSYRFLLSFHALIGLFAMAETNKIYVRSIIAGEPDALPGLWYNRLAFAAIPIVILVAGLTVDTIFQTSITPEYWTWIAVISAIIFVTDFYIPHLQAQEKFPLLLGVESIKYASAFVIFLGIIQQDFPIEIAVISMLLSIAAINAILTICCLQRLFAFPAEYKNIPSLLRSKPAHQARTYSFANMFPASLEHIDKLLVGWVFGLEWLGIYALAYSTGRLIYNALKPAFYIYYRQFVDQMPAIGLLWRTGIIGTIFGFSCAGLFWFLVHSWPAMNRFQIGANITIILLCGYGIGLVRAIYGQAFALNQRSRAGHAWRASLVTCMLTLPLLALALSLPPAVGLVFLALQYPLRDAVGTGLMVRYRASAK